MPDSADGGGTRPPKDNEALAEKLRAIRRTGMATEPSPIRPLPQQVPPATTALSLLERADTSSALAGRQKWAAEEMDRAIQAAKEPEPDLAIADGILLGTSENSAPVLLPQTLRNRHVYVLGKTRTGKTTLLLNLMKRDIREGRSLCFIDPHGDAANELLAHIPAARHADTLYFDPSRPDAPAFNPFRLRYQPAKLTEDILSVFKMFFGDSWGPRMEHILRYAVLALLSDSEPHCLSDLRPLLAKSDYRTALARRLAHPQLREFWQTEFARVPSNATQPIINKLSAFLAPLSDLERVFSEIHNDIDFTEVLDGKILIVNLAKGKIGEEPSRLLGGLFAACLQQAALARANVPEADRTAFYFFVDEFQNYTVTSFESILAESGKYMVNLTLANQNLGQLPSSMKAAIFGNVATLVAFQVSAEDAPVLAREMRRTRIRVREKSKHDWQPLHEFLEEWAHLARVYPESQEVLHHPPYALREWQQAHHQFIIRAFEAVSLNPPSVVALRNAFNRDSEKYEFQEYVFPAVEDFSNLPLYHAFIKRERAENVVRFKAAGPDTQGEDENNRRDLFSLFGQQAEERRRATELKKAAIAEVALAQAAAVAEPEPPVEEEPSPVPTPAPSLVPTPASASTPASAVPEISERQEPAKIPAARVSKVPRPPQPSRLAPTLLGRGGPKHKYLQDFVKRMAESKGFRAVIEEPVLDGTGSIDVALFRGEQKIACEISVTSAIDQERANVTKCRQAGYGSVILIAPEAKDVRKLEAITGEHPAGAVQIMRPEEFVEYLDAVPMQEKVTEQVVRGYKVKTRWKPMEGADADARRKAVAQVLSQGMRRLKDDEA